ncbi:hypothetical protein A2U01_0065063 [Trifolium medium]|uniref:Uncharacterized protein n=1 Tax=Trifolium medium TaxID=97028 RepID=A0A392S7G5_9FABA|nr:hypothetical protein [Trifolium medium]
MTTSSKSSSDTITTFCVVLGIAQAEASLSLAFFCANSTASRVVLSTCLSPGGSVEPPHLYVETPLHRDV